MALICVNRIRSKAAALGDLKDPAARAWRA